MHHACKSGDATAVPVWFRESEWCLAKCALAGSRVSAFEEAADCIVSGDKLRLRELPAGNPGLVRERSTREHRSTLLHYVPANGVEDFRQKTPGNIVVIANLLPDAGAEDGESAAYGGGCTALGLVATSVHPDNCIANGEPGEAKFLADPGALPDVETAAAVRRLDVLRRYFNESGVPQPRTDQEKLRSGFFYAGGYGQMEAVRFLPDHGVDPAARNGEGETALHRATRSHQPAVIRLLLEHGAPVDAKDALFDGTALDMVLWTWSRATADEGRERYYEAFALPARRGAKLDRVHWSDPAADRSFMLDRIDGNARMPAALRGKI